MSSSALQAESGCAQVTEETLTRIVASPKLNVAEELTLYKVCVHAPPPHKGIRLWWDGSCFQRKRKGSVSSLPHPALLQLIVVPPPCSPSPSLSSF